MHFTHLGHCGVTCHLVTSCAENEQLQLQWFGDILLVQRKHRQIAKNGGKKKRNGQYHAEMMAQ